MWCTPDSGCTQTIVSEKLVLQNQVPLDKDAEVPPLVAADGSSMACLLYTSDAADE